jgi:hypothetical protein
LYIVVLDKFIIRSSACNTGVLHRKEHKRLGVVMKSLIRIVVATVAVVSSFSALAQSNDGATRAQVKAQLIQLERAGYNPDATDPTYPSKLLAAESRITNSEGGVVSTTQGSGYRGMTPTRTPVPPTGLSAPDVGQ